MKKIFLAALALQAFSPKISGQVIYSNSFNNLALQNYTTTATAVDYTNVPTGFTLINDGLKNNAGPVWAPNKPFNVPALKTTGWATVYNAAENDTFLVSTSWLDTSGVSANRWIVMPPVSVPGGTSTVLTWLAKSPDPAFPEGYEVYGTTNVNAALATDFAPGDLLFSLADGNTQGQGEKSSWTRHSINLSSFAGQTLRFAFRNNSRDMYQLWIDDIEVKTLSYSLDASVQEVIADKYVLVNSSNIVQANVINNGASNLTAFGLNYIVNNSSITSELFTLATPLAYGQSTVVSFPLPYTVSSPGLYTIKSWIGSVNNVADQNQSNDSAAYNVTIQNTTPAKTVLMEQFISANNGESPNAQVKTASFEISPVIVVNIHDQDSLKEAGSAALIADYKQDMPSAMLDRRYYRDLGRNTLEVPEYDNRLNVAYYKLSPAAISITNKIYNASTRELSFTVKADFVGEVKGDYRINAYLTENYVCGPYTDTTVNGFNQLNDYYNISWSPYYHSGYFSPLVNTYVMNALGFKHRNTLVHSFDGAYGLPGTIPSTGGTQGQSFQKTFTITLPPTPVGAQKFIPDNLYVVGFVSEYNADKTKREVLNATRTKLTPNAEFVGVPEIGADLALSVFPNPSNTGLFYLNTKETSTCDLKVFDLFGKCLKAENGRKAGTLDLSEFSDGIYLLNLRSGKSVSTQKIVIQKN